MLLTIVLALAVSALAGFLALIVCSLAGFAGVSLANGTLWAMPMAFPALLLYAMASRSSVPTKTLRVTFRLLLALSVSPVVVFLIAEVLGGEFGWMRGWDSASMAVMIVLCVAMAAGQWVVFRLQASHARPASPMRFGRQP